MARSSSKTTTDHEEIRRWAEERGGKPSTVAGTGGDEPGILRIDFPPYGNEGKLEDICWDDWFQKFEENNLALLYEDKPARGGTSYFNKLISADTAESSSRGRNGSSNRSRSKGATSSGQHGSRSTGARKASSSRSRSSSASSSTRSGSSSSSRRSASGKGASSGSSRTRQSASSGRKAQSGGRAAAEKKSLSARGRSSSSGRASTKRTKTSATRSSSAKKTSRARG